MRHITISGHHGGRRMVAAAFWIVVGIVAVFAFGDILTLLAVALAIVTTAWWIRRAVEHHVERNDARRYVTGVGSRADHSLRAWARSPGARSGEPPSRPGTARRHDACAA
jgi:hypothetical protein